MIPEQNAIIRGFLLAFGNKDMNAILRIIVC